MARQSRIDQLPKDLRERLDKLLADPAVTDLDATARLNEWLQGSDEKPIGKSTVGRRGQQVRAAGEKMLQSRQMAEVLVGQVGAEPASKTGKMLAEILQSIVFDVLIKLREQDDVEVAIGSLNKLALTLQRLESAQTANSKRDAEIRQQAREEAAEEAASEAVSQGLTAEKAALIRDRVLAGKI
jgi:hypothetical protein